MAKFIGQAAGHLIQRTQASISSPLYCPPDEARNVSRIFINSNPAKTLGDDDAGSNHTLSVDGYSQISSRNFRQPLPASVHMASNQWDWL